MWSVCVCAVCVWSVCGVCAVCVCVWSMNVRSSLLGQRRLQAAQEVGERRSLDASAALPPDLVGGIHVPGWVVPAVGHVAVSVGAAVLEDACVDFRIDSIAAHTLVVPVPHVVSAYASRPTRC